MLSYVAELDEARTVAPNPAFRHVPMHTSAPRTQAGNYKALPELLEEALEGNLAKWNAFKAQVARWWKRGGLRNNDPSPKKPKPAPTEMALPVLPSRMALPDVAFPG